MATVQLIAWLGFGIINFSCLGQVKDNYQEVMNYQLKFLGEDLRRVQILASFNLQEPWLRMNEGGIPADIPNGWAHFVEIISIKQAKTGQQVDYHWDDSARKWTVEAVPNQRIEIQYEVKLQHDQYNWSSAGGIDARPSIHSGPNVLWITKGLFIFPEGAADRRTQVVFEVPAHWQISTPWISDPNRPNTFHVANIGSLSNNLLMLGHHQQKRIRHDDMSITFAITPELSHRSELFINTLKDILPVYKDVFGELPETNYLICTSKNAFEDGEAFYNSFHQMFVDQDLSSRKIVWANVLAHEMFHYWNGTNFLVGEDIPGHYWFSEGFTEYYSNLALVRAGIITPDEFLSKLAFQFSRYYTAKFLFPPPRPSLVDAGYQKGRNWGLIYGGGSTIAFVLDIEIRKVTNGEKTLDDLMKYLYMTYGKPKKLITQEDLVQSFNEITGKNFQTFFDQYIFGNEIVPLLEACKTAGLTVAQYQGEFYLRASKNVSGAIIYEVMGDRTTNNLE